jgi:hypothetical protein
LPTRRPAIIVAVLSSLIALAVIKPWGGGPGPGGTAPHVAGQTASVPPTSALPSPSASNDIATCLAGSDWRVSALQVNDGRLVKSWYSVVPAIASRPIDAAIPTVRVYAESVRRLGFCAGAGVGSSDPGVSAWRIDPSGRSMTLALTNADDPGLADAGLGMLFVPSATGTVGTPGDWSPGRYVFAVGIGPRAANRRWFAVEIVAVGPDLTSPAGSPNPAGSTMPSIVP